MALEDIEALNLCLAGFPLVTTEYEGLRKRRLRMTSQTPPRQLEHAPQVGAAGPERRNSPVQTDPEQSFELLREQLGDEAAGCYFNDHYYAEGSQVLSGSTCLRCERGIWREVEAETSR